MRLILRSTLGLALLATAACDEIAVANDPAALADLRGQKSCIRAVTEHTGATGATINTTIPIIELNRYVVDVPNNPSFTCITDDNGSATQIVQIATG